MRIIEQEINHGPVSTLHRLGVRAHPNERSASRGRDERNGMAAENGASQTKTSEKQSGESGWCVGQCERERR